MRRSDKRVLLYSSASQQIAKRRCGAAFSAMCKPPRNEEWDDSYLFEDCSRAVADKGEPSPIDGKSLIAEFFQQIEFGLTQRGTLIVAICQVLVHPFHESDREGVVGGPERRDHRPCAGQKEGAFETCDSLLTEQPPAARVASGKDYQFGV